ncbi:hypothetical protein CEXT_761261 [Caerostris extrusa]|uniref:Uncharacterized protein n=1 Tax=Caerostris extrusa TaxID=172846 RepID=A0AAV4WW49_CAEEX|nr:hypothetical protein CEXT_761261 [Caerostris extrusa]
MKKQIPRSNLSFLHVPLLNPSRFRRALFRSGEPSLRIWSSFYHVHLFDFLAGATSISGTFSECFPPPSQHDNNFDPKRLPKKYFLLTLSFSTGWFITIDSFMFNLCYTFK